MQLIKKSNIAYHTFKHTIGCGDFEIIDIGNKIFVVVVIGLKLFSMYVQWNLKKFQLRSVHNFLILQHLLLNDFLKYIRIKIKDKTIYFHNFQKFIGLILVNHLFKNLDKKRNVKIIIKSGIILQIIINRTSLQAFYTLSRFNLNQTVKEFFSLESFNTKLRVQNLSCLTFQVKTSTLINYFRITIHKSFEIIKFLRREIYNLYKIDISLHLSFSSLSLKIFKTLSIQSKSFAINLSLADSFIRKSYFGGVRFDLVIPDKFFYYQFDVNSLYSFIMINNPFPTGTSSWVSGSNLKLTSFFGFCHLSLFIPSFLYFGIIPAKFKNKNVYTTGQITGIYFSEELKFLISLGCKVLKIFSACSFRQTFIFTRFVGHLFLNRLKSKVLNKKISDNLFKQLLNCLHGRFGIQKNYLSTPQPQHIDVVAENKINTITYSQTKKYLLKPPKFLSNTCIHLSSAISSYSRIFLFNFLYLIFSKSVQIFYCNTDSLVCSNVPPINLVSRNMMGFLKFERKSVCQSKKSGFFSMKEKLKDFSTQYLEANIIRKTPCNFIIINE